MKKGVYGLFKLLNISYKKKNGKKNICNIKNKCIEFVNNFDNPDYKNLLFVGSTGLR